MFSHRLQYDTMFLDLVKFYQTQPVLTELKLLNGGVWTNIFGTMIKFNPVPEVHPSESYGLTLRGVVSESIPKGVYRCGFMMSSWDLIDINGNVVGSGGSDLYWFITVI
jgi:hypothetical protein